MTAAKPTHSGSDRTNIVVSFQGHPVVDEVAEVFKQVIADHQWTGEVKQGRVDRHMDPATEKRLGIYIVTFSFVLLATTVWAWSTGSRVLGSTGTIKARFLWITFHPSAAFCNSLFVALAAMLGSMVVLGMTFAHRAGHETLERGYVWWYVTRPAIAACLGLLFYVTVVAGFFNSSTAKDRPALVVAGAIGGFAGLFSDQVIAKLRDTLGLLPVNKPASAAADDQSHPKSG